MITIPGWEGTIGPFPAQYSQPHVYARDIHSGAGNCVCAHGLWDARHIAPAPGIEFPKRRRPHEYTGHGHPCCDQAAVEHPRRVARCGGRGICAECARQAAQIHARSATVQTGDTQP